LAVQAFGLRSVPADDIPIGSGLAESEPAESEPTRSSDPGPAQLAPVIHRRKEQQPAGPPTLAPVVKRATPESSIDARGSADSDAEAPTAELEYGEPNAVSEAVTIDLRGIRPAEGPNSAVSSWPAATEPRAASPNHWPAHEIEAPVSRLRTGQYVPDRSGRLVRIVPRTTPNLPAALAPREDFTEHSSGSVSPAAVESTGWERHASDHRTDKPLAPVTKIPAVLVAEQTGDQPQQPASPSDVQRPEPQPIPLEPVPASPEELNLPSQTQELLSQEGFRPMRALGVNIAPQAGVMPPDRAAGWFAEAGEQIQTTGYSRPTMETHFDWTAPAVCYRPLFFEDMNLERHGYQVKHVQPLFSAAHFFSRLPAVPYLAMSQRYRQCNYTLGHYRPGSDAPYLWYYPRLSLTGASLEGAVIAGLILAIP
jgi:hypothetical protein